MPKAGLKLRRKFTMPKYVYVLKLDALIYSLLYNMFGLLVCSE